VPAPPPPSPPARFESAPSSRAVGLVSAACRHSSDSVQREKARVIFAFVRPARAVPLAASCALHLALLGVVAGLLPHWGSPIPAVLEAGRIGLGRPPAP